MSLGLVRRFKRGANNQSSSGGQSPTWWNVNLLISACNVCITSESSAIIIIAYYNSGDRIPVGARFSAPVQTGSVAHPTFYTVGTWSFPGLKRPGRGVDHPPASNAEVEGRVELYICSPSGASWALLGSPLPLPLLYIICNTYYNYCISNRVLLEGCDRE